MAQEHPLQSITLEAAADLSAKQHYIAQIDSAGKAALASASTQKLFGPIGNKPKSGEAAEIKVYGTAKVIYGGTVDEGDYLTTDANGKAIKTITDKDVVIGIAVVAGVSNDIGEVLLGRFTLSAT